MQRVFAVLFAFALQAVAAAGAVASWVSAGNIAPPGSGCSYDGTCADDGAGAVALCVLLTPTLELIVGWIWAGAQLRKAPDGRAALRFSSIVGHRVLVTVTAGCLCWLILYAQAVLLTHLAVSQSQLQCPAASTNCIADHIQARLFLNWTNATVGVELAVAALVIVAILGTRRAARRRTRAVLGAETPAGGRNVTPGAAPTM